MFVAGANQQDTTKQRAKLLYKCKGGKKKTQASRMMKVFDTYGGLSMTVKRKHVM